MGTLSKACLQLILEYLNDIDKEACRTIPVISQVKRRTEFIRAHLLKASMTDIDVEPGANHDR